MTSTSETRIAIIDAIGGISGDMFLGACLDSGVLTFEELRATLAPLVPTDSLAMRREERASISGTRLVVELDERHQHDDEHHERDQHDDEHHEHDQHDDEQHEHDEHRSGHHEANAHHGHGRTLGEVATRIERSCLSPKARRTAIAIYTRLAEAEARVHGREPSHVHLHEVAADDSIFDVCGTALALERLDASRIFCRALPLGGGSVSFSHGRWPVPAPAVLELLRGCPTTPGELPFEMTTPTGAAIARVAVTDWGEPNEMLLDAVGYGHGRGEHPMHPNTLRLRIGRLTTGRLAGCEEDSVDELRFVVDDLPPCDLAPTIDVLLALGALDVFATLGVGKKGRFAHELCVLVPPRESEAIIAWILRESATIGVRRQRIGRHKLGRETRRAASDDLNLVTKRLVGPAVDDVRIAIEADSVSEYCRQYRVGPRRAREELARRLAEASPAGAGAPSATNEHDEER